MSLAQTKFKLISNSLNVLTVIAPIGAFGNHLRNLLILDPIYNFTYFPTKEEYDIFSGPDWPSYDTYCTVGISDNISNDIKQEIKNLCSKNNFLNTAHIDCIESKINFIQQVLYTNTRTWHNWMWHESQWRKHLDSLITFTHDISAFSSERKYVVLTINPHLAYKSYVKFNSNVNNVPADYFLSQVELYNQRASTITDNNVLVVSADTLFAETLDKELYIKIISWLGYNNLYQDANIIHHTWYKLHKKSEKEIVEYFTNLYNS